MKKNIAVCLVTALVLLCSCGSGRVVYSEKPPDPVYDRPKSPDPSFVWKGPQYIKKDGKYEYQSGYWISPKNKAHRWIEGRWKHTRRGWVWEAGHWGR
ncbi:MAG: hypothetical protein ACKOU7_07085 [Ferruginibacter sp.]